MNKTALFSLIFVSAFALFSCSKKTSLESSIPSDAMMISHYDVKKMVQKADFNLFENTNIVAFLDIFKSHLLPEQQELLTDFTKNPNSTGIDFLSDFYFFSRQNSAVFVFPVNDAKKLYNSILAIDKGQKNNIKQSSNEYSLELPFFGSLAWNKSKLIVLIDNRLSAVLAKDFLHLKKEESFEVADNYKLFVDAKSDITTCYLLKNFSGIFENLPMQNIEYQSIIESFEQILAKLDMSVISFVSFEKGLANVCCKTVFATPESEQFYHHLSSFNRKIEGNLLKFIPENPILCIAANCDGETLLADYDKLGFTPIFETLNKEYNIDYQELISAFCGDMVLSLNSMNYQTTTDFEQDSWGVAQVKPNPAISFYAEVKNSESFKKLLEKYISKYLPNAKKNKENSYSIEKNIVFGLNDNIFYITANNSGKSNFFASNIDNPLIDKIKGQQMYFGGDLRTLKNEYIAANGGEFANKLMVDALSLVKTFGTEYIDNQTFEVNVNFTDKTKNSLALICVLLEELINEYLN
ncbi:MAG: DUF4836 family protein [Prevotellaceae bacterium]|jgi:hypothetical protein|nr:DUF4836 family protein [Prevotellaceae bacterium]